MQDDDTKDSGAESDHDGDIEETDGPMGIDDIKNLLSDLRGIAYNLLRGERDGCSVRPTALVLSGLRRYKVAGQTWEEVSWQNRSHFFRSAYIMMRRALIDRSRRIRARPQVAFTDPANLYDIPRVLEETPDRIISLDEALTWLSGHDAELAAIVQHHYFTGLKVSEISEMLAIAERTVKRRLQQARILLRARLEELESEDPTSGES